MLKELSLVVHDTNKSRGYQATTTSQQTAAFSSVGVLAPAGQSANAVPITITSAGDIAVARGANPTAIYPANGVDGSTPIPAGVYRTVVMAGEKLAYISKTGTVDVVITVDG